jgi:undecaprenyl-diphosphatase
MLFIVLALLMLCFAKTRRAGGTALAAMAFGLVVTNLTIKPLMSRARPWVVMEGFETLVRSSDPNSFPSGHTCAAFAFAIAVCMVLPQRWAKAAAVAAAVLMGFSRLYVGVHFPSDVLAGAFIGSMCGLLASWIVTKALERFKARAVQRAQKRRP